MLGNDYLKFQGPRRVLGPFLTWLPQYKIDRQKLFMVYKEPMIFRSRDGVPFRQANTAYNDLLVSLQIDFEKSVDLFESLELCHYCRA